MLLIIIIQFFGIFSLVKIMKCKTIIAKDRWMWSLIIFMIPLVGVFL